MITKRGFVFGASAATLVLASGCAEKKATAHAAAAPVGKVTAQGGFVGDSGHKTSGEATISLHDGVWMVNLGPDFSFDGAPDPKVALGRGGYKAEAQLASLRSNSGAQSYAIPASLDVADYDQVWIWCEQFRVPLGHADLTLA